MLLLISISISSFCIDIEDSELKCMTRAIYVEARGESYSGKLAVAHVILNRIKSGYGTNVCDILSKPKQFPWYNKSFKVLEPKVYDSINELSKSILNGKTKDPTNGSIFFHEKSLNPNWKYKKIKIIGNHIFYKLI
jgi:spore germination cell wall hydrolase CwlJ-like protein